MSVVTNELALPELTIAAEGSTYAHRLLNAMERFADRPAVRWKESGEWYEYSYREFESHILACAAALKSHGVGHGDRIAIWLENSPPWLICDFAAQLIGAITTTVYHTLVPAQAMALLEDADVAAVFSNRERLDGLAEIRGVPKKSVLEVSADLNETTVSFKELLEEGKTLLNVRQNLTDELRCPSVKSTDLSALVYTSGTTGEPKGVMLTHANMLANVDATIAQLVAEGSPVILLHLPLAHVMARNTTVPATLLTGGVLAVAEPERERIAQNLIEVAPTVFPTVPHLLEKFRERVMEAISKKGFVMRNLAHWALDHCRNRRLAAVARGETNTAPNLGVVGTILDWLVLRNLRAKLGGRLDYLVTGGANSNQESFEFFWGIGIPVYEGYGATEVTSTAAMTSPRAMRLGTVGPPAIGVELSLASDDEVLVRGPIVMKGYWRRTEETHKAIDSDGWYHTGDIGKFNPQGHLTIVDRKREILVLSTGKNVAPQAVENTLKKSPLILAACAIGHRRRYTAAIVAPDLDAIAKRLKQATAPDINDRAVEELLRQEVSSLMEGLSSFERIKRMALIRESFSPENGMLTPTLKLQRHNIADRYAVEIEDIYADCPTSAVSI